MEVGAFRGRLEYEAKSDVVGRGSRGGPNC